MKKEIKLENVVSEDCDQIRDIMAKVFQDEKEKWFKDGESPFIPGYHSIEMQKYHIWDNRYYKIVFGNDIVGVILISYTGREHARIDRLYILPEYQGMGIGSDVLQLIEESYPEVNEWTLDTIQQSPRNHHFYEKNGYKLVGEDESERYYRKVKENTYESRNDYCCNKDLSNRNVRECKMEAVDFYESNMSNACLSNMNLRGNIYQNSCLTGSRFTNVDLSNSVFADGRMNKVEICFVSLTEAYIHDINLDTAKDKRNVFLERCELSNSKISDSNLQNVCIENCNIEGMVINGVKVEDLLRVYHNTIK